MRGAPFGMLVTDLYQLNMLAAYHEHGLLGSAVFEFFVRALPPSRRYLVAAGLEQVLEFLEGLQFSAEELEWLGASGRFSPAFVDWLARLRFTGAVDAVPEGTVVFENEPLLRITAPLPEAQLIETRLINLLHYQTVVASKAARMVAAAPGRVLVDFGLRRAHGADAGLLAARAAYLAGFAGTATVSAGAAFDIPLYGTMAHSFVLAHDDEEAAFLAFARSRPRQLVLLLDTYDTAAAARTVVAIAPRLAALGAELTGVRLDSGDLAAEARLVRGILDGAGLHRVTIFASGGLDEHKIARLLAAGAPIDGFGIGTSLVVPEDAPTLDCAYKLQAYDGRPKRKRSTGKATWPGAKQIFRRRDAAGRIAADVVGRDDETLPGEPLLVPVMAGGRRLGPPVPLAESRARARRQLAALPPELLALDGAARYAVAISPAIAALARQADALVGTSSRPPG